MRASFRWSSRPPTRSPDRSWTVVPRRPVARDRCRADRRWAVAVEFALQAADEPSLLVDAGDGLAGAADPAGAGRPAATARRRRCWPSWAGPAGSTRTWTPRCAPPRPAALDARRRRARTGSSRGRAGAGTRPGSGCCCRAGGSSPSARLGARLQRPQPHRARARSPAAEPASAWTRSSTTAGSWRSATSRSTADELAALAELKTPLVRLRGQWVELDPRGSPPGCELLRAGRRADRRPTCSGSAWPTATRPGGAAGGGGRPPTAGSATCWPAQAERRLDPGRPRRRASPGTLRPYQAARPGLAGLPAVGSGSAACSPTTWAWARPCSCSRCSPATRPERRRRRLLVCPMSLVGNWQREAARFTPELRVHVHHGAERARGEAFADGRGRRATWSSPPTRWPPGTRPRCAGSTGTGSWSTRRRRSRTPPPGRPTAVRVAARPAPDRGHRHAGGEPAGRPVVDHGVRQPGPARAGRDVQEAVRRADRAARRRRGGRAAAPVHRPVRAAPAQDRQVDHLRPAGEAGDGGALQPHRRAGRALPGRGRRHAGPDREQRRASSGAAWCWPP